MSLIVTVAAERRAKRSVAVMTSFWDLGLLVAGPLSGATADRYGYSASFGLATVVAAGAFAVAVGTKTRAVAPDPAPITR